jgi:hypothetical protein
MCEKKQCVSNVENVGGCTSMMMTFPRLEVDPRAKVRNERTSTRFGRLFTL